MARHLRILGVPDTQMLLEDRSTTTWENLRFSRDLIAEHSSGGAPRSALVTSDYHVFRAAMYARAVGLSADGLGSRTARYYFPTASSESSSQSRAATGGRYAAIMGLWVFTLFFQILR